MNKIIINRHGCSQIPTFYQSLTYLLYFPNLLTCFLVVSLIKEFEIHLTLLSILTVLSLYSSIKTTLSCPTDQFLIMQYDKRIRGLPFEYEKHKLESFCDLCEAYVKENTKHCKHCNRCCQDFDHHCKWVNNCIGNLNYKIFMMMVITTTLLFSYTVIIYIRILILYNIDYDLIWINNERQKFHFFSGDLDFKYILSIVMLADSSLIFILLLQLLLFHIYLIVNKITTYEFIVKKDIKKINPQNTFSNAMGGLQYREENHQSYQIEIKKTIIDINISSDQTVIQQEKMMSNKDDASNNNQIVS